MFLCRLFSLFTLSVSLGLSAQTSTAGLAVTFTAGDQTDQRVDRLLSLYVPAGQSPTPFLQAGPFTIQWSGEIQSPIRGTFLLSAETSGNFKLNINGQPILLGTTGKAVQLNKGANVLTLSLIHI